MHMLQPLDWKYWWTSIKYSSFHLHIAKQSKPMTILPWVLWEREKMPCAWRPAASPSCAALPAACTVTGAPDSHPEKTIPTSALSRWLPRPEPPRRGCQSEPAARFLASPCRTAARSCGRGLLRRLEGKAVCSEVRAFPYPWRVLFHLVLVAVGTAGMAPPEAVLTELVIVTLLAAVAKPHHALAVAVGTLDGVEDCTGERNAKP